MPETERDQLHVYRFVPSMGGGVFQDRTIFKGTFELFKFETTATRSGSTCPRRTRRSRSQFQHREGRRPRAVRSQADDSDADPRGPQRVLRHARRDRSRRPRARAAAAPLDRAATRERPGAAARVCSHRHRPRSARRAASASSRRRGDGCRRRTARHRRATPSPHVGDLARPTTQTSSRFQPPSSSSTLVAASTRPAPCRRVDVRREVEIAEPPLAIDVVERAGLVGRVLPRGLAVHGDRRLIVLRVLDGEPAPVLRGARDRTCDDVDRRRRRSA